MKTKNIAAIIIGILTAISFCVIFILSTKMLHYKAKLESWQSLTHETTNLLERAINKGEEYKEHSEALKKHLEETISQLNIIQGVAETALENAKKIQKQRNELLNQLQWYQEHVNGYIAVITWYEEKCGNCPDPNLPDFQNFTSIE